MTYNLFQVSLTTYDVSRYIIIHNWKYITLTLVDKFIHSYSTGWVQPKCLIF
jgi:hypothetical protein